MEGRVVKQDLIPNVGQLELANVPVKGWIIDPDVHGLLYGSSDVVHLPIHYGGVIHTDVMTRDVAMVINGGRGSKVFLSLIQKVPANSAMYSSSQSSWSHLYTCILPHIAV